MESIAIIRYLARHDVLIPELSHVLAELVLRTVVIDNDVGRAAFLNNRPLGGFSLVELGLSPTPGASSGESRSAVGVDHQHNVAHRPPPSFQQKRSVEHHGRSASPEHFLALGLKPLANSRVKQVFKKLALSRRVPSIAKYMPCHGRPVNAAIGREHTVAPTSPQSVPHFGILCQHGMTGAVGIQTRGAKLHQQFCNMRFSTRHAADKTNGFYFGHG